MTRKRISTRFPVIMAFLSIFGMPGLFAFAQEDPLITAAANQLNSLVPGPVAQQTIPVGTYDGSNNKFTFSLEEGYPNNVPDYKKSEYGGPYKPQHIAEINSYNVKYEFQIQHKPPNFKLTLRTPDANGQPAELLATVNAAGTLASVTWNPHRQGMWQTVTISGGGATRQYRIITILRANLGAFVVPYLLVSIVYEPPGQNVLNATSQGSFGQVQKATTSISWGFEQSVGVVRTVTYDDLSQALVDLKALGDGTKAIKDVGSVVLWLYGYAWAPGVSEVVDKASAAIDGITSALATTGQVTTVQGQTSGGDQGTSISVTAGAKTNIENGNQYSGGDDRFIYLRNVMFVYLVGDNGILLAPVAYSQPWRGPSAQDINNELPSAVADKWLKLDPLLPGGPPLNPPLAHPDGVNVPIWKRPWRFEHPAWLPALACESGGPNFESVTLEQFSSVRSGQTTSRTEVTNFSKLEQLFGQHSTNQPLTYSSSFVQFQHTESSATVAEVDLQCAMNDEFEVDLYLDKVFRTLVPVKGPPLSSQPTVSGSVTDQQGRPVIGRQVILTIGARSYSVRSDHQGNFAFRFSTIPKGSGSLAVGPSSVAVTVAAAPIKGLQLKVHSGLVH